MLFKSIEENPLDVKFESQGKDEQLCFLLRRHPITNLGWILNSIFLLFLPVLLMALSNYLELNTFKYIRADTQVLFIVLWYLLTLFFTFESFLIWYFNIYIITNKRVIDIDFKGLWSKRISEAPSLESVEDVTYETNKFLHILFDYGDIFMQTAAEKTEFEFKSIPKPALVHDKLTDLVQHYKEGNKS